MFKFSKPRWQVLKDKKVYETPIFSLHEKDVVPDGEKGTKPFYVLEAPEWINVIALTEDGNIVLVEQYRHGIDETTLEIPGGMTDAGETPLKAAKRELVEETGYTSNKWTFLGKSSSNPAIINNFTHLYLAENCAKTEKQHTDGTEDIAVHTLPVADFLKYVKEGIVHHAIVMAAVSLLLLNMPELNSLETNS